MYDTASEAMSCDLLSYNCRTSVMQLSDLGYFFKCLTVFVSDNNFIKVTQNSDNFGRSIV